MGKMSRKKSKKSKNLIKPQIHTGTRLSSMKKHVNKKKLSLWQKTAKMTFCHASFQDN